MAARHLPHIPMEAIAQTITIDSTYVAHPQAVRIPAGQQQQVSFTNNSAGTISIQFELNPPGPTMFANIPTLVNGATDTQTANVDTNGNGAVNYYVYDSNNTKHGPYAIEVGNGPLYVSVTYSQSLNEGQCTPDPVVIPYQGHLEMYSTDYNYSVGWPTSFGDPFQPQLLSTVPGATNNSPVQEVANLAEYKYTVTKTGIQGVGGGGGGKVIVKGS
jgi:hypothetical protein